MKLLKQFAWVTAVFVAYKFFAFTCAFLIEWPSAILVIGAVLGIIPVMAFVVKAKRLINKHAGSGQSWDNRINIYIYVGCSIFILYGGFLYHDDLNLIRSYGDPQLITGKILWAGIMIGSGIAGSVTMAAMCRRTADPGANSE